MLVVSQGIDPALRHGAWVKTTWNVGDHRTTLEEYDVLYEWHGKNAGIGQRAEPKEIGRFVNQILESVDVPTLLGIPVAIDYTTFTGHMGQRLQASVMSYFIGYLHRGLQTLGIPVHIISPLQLRKALGHPGNMRKEDLLQHYPVPGAREDVQDAILLAYTLVKRRRRIEAPETGQAGIPGSETRSEHPTDTPSSRQVPARGSTSRSGQARRGSRRINYRRRTRTAP